LYFSITIKNNDLFVCFSIHAGLPAQLRNFRDRWGLL
jgi:hypothetical protein